MNRFNKIDSITFGGSEIKLPIEVELSRTLKTSPAFSDNHQFSESIEYTQKNVIVSITCRDIPSIESLDIGQQATLQIITSSGDSQSAKRRLIFSNAILTTSNINYSQKDFASGKLSFICESTNGTTSPFSSGAIT